MQKSTKIKGYLFGIVGGLCISPDALLSRLVNIDLTSLIFWRTLFSAVGFFLILALLNGKNTLNQFKNWNKTNYLMVLIQGITPTGFVLGIKLTSVVNVLVIFAMTPILTALFSWFLYAKKPTKITLVCIVIAFIGMGLVIVDGFLLEKAKLSLETAFVIPYGEICALLAAVILSFGFAMANANPNTNYLSSQCVGTLLMAICILPFNAVWLLDAQNLTLLLAIGFLVQASASSLLFLSTKYITSTESALMLLIETVIGPFLVWLFLKESPTFLALTGGGIILFALISNVLLQLKAKNKYS